MDKEPKILRVPSPGDGRRFEQITRDGKMTYAHYRPADALNPTETISYDRIQSKQGNGDAEIHLIPMQNPLWLLAGEPAEPRETLWEDIKGYIYAHVDFPDARLYDVATGWVFTSWLREASNISPYFRLYGVRNCGKTRCLEVFQHLSYRGVLTPSVSEAALYRLIQDYKVSYLLDESEIYSTETKQAVQNVLNSGYRRGQLVLRCESAEDGSIIVEGFDVFGPKAIASTETLKTTLESRCIPVTMERATRHLNFVVNAAEANQLRSRLLLWRFRRIADLDAISEDSEGGEASEGALGGVPPGFHSVKDSRIVEIFSSLFTLAVGEEARANILSYALNVYEETMEEDATGAEAQIIAAIKRTHPNLESGKFSTKEASDYFNGDKPEPERWRTSSIGRLIKKLGFKPRRMTGGRSGWIYDADRVDRLSERYDTPPSQRPSLPSLLSLTSLNNPAEPTPTPEDTPRPCLSENLTQLSQALRGAGTRGVKPNELAEGTGIPPEEIKQLLSILQRDHLAFTAPGDTWRWVP
jgi:hypothetical protein